MWLNDFLNVVGAWLLSTNNCPPATLLIASNHGKSELLITDHSSVYTEPHYNSHQELTSARLCAQLPFDILHVQICTPRFLRHSRRSYLLLTSQFRAQTATEPFPSSQMLLPWRATTRPMRCLPTRYGVSFRNSARSDSSNLLNRQRALPWV